MKKTFTILSALLVSCTTFAQFPSNGLQLYCTFDGNTTDFSGNDHEVSTSGTDYLTRFANSLGDSVIRNTPGETNNTFLNYTGSESDFETQDFTIVANYDAMSIGQTYANLYELGASNGVQVYFRIRYNGSSYYLEAGHYNETTQTGNHAQVTINSLVSNYHRFTFASSYDSNNLTRTITLYYDGNVLHTETYNLNTLIDFNSATKNIQILGRNGNQALSAPGKMDDFLFYNRTLDANEIMEFENLCSFVNKFSESNGDYTAVEMPFVSFEWTDCSSYSTVFSTAATFTPTISGDYALITTYDNSADVCKDTSACFNISIAGVNNLNTDAYFKLFPNPATTSLTLTNLPTDATIQLIDQTGRIVTTENATTQTQSIATNTLHSGIYFVHVTGKNGETSTQKLVIE